MRTIRLEAWDEKVVELTAEEADALAATDLVRVVVDAQSGSWRVVTDSRVGVVWREGEWELRVRPKLAIPRLMFLLGYAADPAGWRDAAAPVAAEEHLYGAVASGFAYHAQRALSPAPIHGYVTVEEQATTLRGQLRFTDQLARWPGLPIPLELAHDDYTADIAENRLLRGATELLLRLPRVSERARRRLLAVRASLEDVLPSSPGPEVKALAITRLNARYGPALALAELILRHTSIATHGGEVRSVSFVFDMNRVFEDFLSAALRASLERHGGAVRLQDGRERLDVGGSIRLIPDISWWRGHRCLAVIDAKYKRLLDAQFPNADAYQMLGYCTALRLPRGYLVYAKDTGEVPRTHVVRNANIELAVRTVDVEQEPESVLASVERLAHEISAAAAARAA
jgi:5-methylcytosine-specific restriction enzyme subunit McrC